jgi:hypothetical protein
MPMVAKWQTRVRQRLALVPRCVQQYVALMRQQSQAKWTPVAARWQTRVSHTRARQRLKRRVALRTYRVQVAWMPTVVKFRVPVY